MPLQAFVGYRDHSLPHHRFEVKDFLLKEDSTEMHSFVSAIRDIGNHDIAEDVAGGLEVHISVCVGAEGAAHAVCAATPCSAQHIFCVLPNPQEARR